MSEPVIIALIGVAGAVIGSVATVSVGIVTHCLKEHAATKRDEPRMTLLREMLNHKDFKWRKLDTLTHVIGADEQTTKRLLLEIGARASEDGEQLWGLLSRNPLPEQQ